MYRILVAFFVATSFLVCSGNGAFAQSAFYQGKTIRLIVGSDAGISYDTYTRLLVPYVRAHIPGHPDIIVQNMPGAGGIVGANYIYNIASRDGLTIGMFNRAAVLSAIVGNPLSKFKPTDIFWLGTAASFSDNAYLFVIKGLPYTTIDEMRNVSRPISIGDSGSAPIRILKDILGLNVKIVQGYNKGELDLAFERGELDGEGIAYANLKARHPQWLSNKLVRPMIQFARQTRHPDFKDVPTAREVARTDEERAIVDLVDAPFLIAYPYGLPPGVPADRAQILRAAFEAALKDPAYEQEARAMKLDYSPKNGADVQSIVAGIASSSPSAIDRYKQIVGDTSGD